MSKTATAEQLPAPARAEHRMIPLAQLRESPMNHRRTWGDMDELVESVRRQGVLQPVLARPLGAQAFELVFGHRRHRAAKTAGLVELPAMVRSMTDVEVLEAQVVENIQRVDVHPLEEAEGYEQLLKQKEKAYTVDDIAAKVGKSKAYVYGRMKLLALCPEARKAFYDGKLTASTALVVARIPHADLQVKALAELKRYSGSEVASFREVAHLVHQNFMLQLKDASFPKADPDLVKGAGPCATCPKRTGAQPELFADVEGGDVCTDPVCFKAKTEAGWLLKKVEFEQAGKKVLSAAETKETFESYGSVKRDSDFVSLDETCHRDPKCRNYRQLIGKSAKDVVVLARDPKGEVRELVPRGEVSKLLKKAGHDFKKERSESDRTSADRANSAKHRAERELNEAVGQKIAALVVSKLESKKPDAQLWRLAAAQAVEYSEETMVRRLGEKQALNRKAVVEHVGKLKEDQARVLLFEVVFESIIHFQGYGEEAKTARAMLLGWASVDEKKVRQEIQAELKAAAAKPAKGKEPLDDLVGTRADAVKRHQASNKKGAARG